jgi:hypothetical protein
MAGSTAGYSGTPLLQKLGVKPGRDVIVFFTTERAELEARIDALGQAIFPNGSLWVGWPKKASKVPTDITENVVRDVVLPKGLVDVKVAAIDETWSGLEIVWRKENR